MEPTFTLRSSLKELKSQAVWASDIGNYWFCDAKILHGLSYPEEKTAEMEKGRRIHEGIAEEDIQVMYDRGFYHRPARAKTIEDVIRINQHNLDTIEDDIVLPDNRLHRAYYGIVLHDPPIVGVPDAIGGTKRDYIVVYEKKQILAPDGTPYLGQRIQLCAYLMSLEQMGIEKCFGVVYTDKRGPDADGSARVFLTPEDRDRVFRAAETIPKIRNLMAEPFATQNPRKCVQCQYGPNNLNVCRFSPLASNRS